MVELTASTAGEYLQRRGVVPSDVRPEARPLGGGVSNHVIEVTWDGGCLVAKQPLANLDVEDDWPADTTRVHNEAAAARTYAAVIDRVGLEDTTVPAVVFEDHDDHVVAFECAPEGARMWKADLLDGRVDRTVAARTGRLLGTVHRSVAGDDSVRQRFENSRPFEQLRLDPYHRTTMRRQPDVATPIEREIDRITDVERTLVHGDYSPKNVLVEPDGRVWVLDFEVAHWGDPAFDVAFMCNHLFIKSVYNHDRHEAYVGAATSFLEAYHDEVPWVVEASTTRELGVLMLARVDGKSPVEYVSEGPVADALRRIAKRTLDDDVRSIDEFTSIVSAEVASL